MFHHKPILIASTALLPGSPTSMLWRFRGEDNVLAGKLTLSQLMSFALLCPLPLQDGNNNVLAVRLSDESLVVTDNWCADSGSPPESCFRPCLHRFLRHGACVASGPPHFACPALLTAFLEVADVRRRSLFPTR